MSRPRRRTNAEKVEKSYFSRSRSFYEIRSRSLDRLDAFFERMLGTELVAVFDIGTKAARIIVAPKTVPTKDQWRSEFFFNDGDIFNLGNELIESKELDIENSIAFLRLLDFINNYVNLLVENGVRRENIHAFGTAVFRWIENKKAVIENIKEETNIDFFVLNEKAESILSLYSLNYTYNISNRNPVPKEQFGEDDVLLLIDQGGGSTEISYIFPTNEEKLKVDSINEMGTIALSNYFFTLSESGEAVAPEENMENISDQFYRLRDTIEEKIDDWSQYPELEGKNIILYAMGSAFSLCLPKGSNFKNHNSKMSLDRAWDILDAFRKKYDRDKVKVRDLYRQFQRSDRNSKDKDYLTIFYGLPVYLEFMAVFNCKEIRFAGFGLRYGAYIYKYQKDRKFEDISLAIFGSEG